MDSSIAAESLHRPIPIFGASQPIDEVKEAYWRFNTLLQSGWYMRSFGYRPATRLAYLYAITPRQRAVTVLCPSRHTVPRVAADFTRAVRDVGLRSDRGHRNHLSDLYHAIYSHPRCQIPAVEYQTRAIPGVDAGDQPNTPVRVAYWMAAMLIDVYGWNIHSLGTPMAGGGFIASIPQDTTVIYPKGSALDNTTAPALARILGRLSPAELDQLRSLLGINDRVDGRDPTADPR